MVLLKNKTNYNIKITEIEGKIPDVNNLATKTALTTVEHKIPIVGSIVNKTDYKTKISKIEKKLTGHDHNKYIITPEYNTLCFYCKIKTSNDFDNGVSSINNKIAINKRKNDSIENELKKLKTLNLSYFIGKSHFEEDGTNLFSISATKQIF